ncbi:hypothetical protein N6H14_01400 [Paenibacillus sp. CC-CFT747]|nr:hypothetical protein N6H14_01400 [Paenibacillus sp. CC-CFT747]
MDRNKEGTETMINKAAGTAPNGDLIISGSGSAGEGILMRCAFRAPGKLPVTSSPGFLKYPVPGTHGEMFRLSGSKSAEAALSKERWKVGSCRYPAPLKPMTPSALPRSRLAAA